MTETEKFLNRAYKSEQLIQSYNQELRDLQELSVSISATDTTKERVQGGGASNNVIEDIFDKISNLRNEIEKEILNFIKLKKEIRDIINQVENTDEKLLLRYRFIQFYDWKTIVINMNTSKTQMYRLKDNALLSVEKILKERKK